jgi:hypothetical protein
VRFIPSDTAAFDVTPDDTWVLEVVDENGNVMLDSLGFPMQYDAQSSISVNNEQLFLDLGLSLTILDYNFAIHMDNLATYVANNGGYNYKNVSTHAQVDFLGSEITYADESKPWLGGVVDNEGDLPDNWIRSGIQEAGPWDEAAGTQNGVEDEYAKWKTEDYFFLMPSNTVPSSSW